MSKDSAPTSKPGTAPALPSMKRGMKSFVQDLSREMKNVTWPTPQESTRLAGVVVALCVSVVLILFGLSMIVEVLLKILNGGA